MQSCSKAANTLRQQREQQQQQQQEREQSERGEQLMLPCRLVVCNAFSFFFACQFLQLLVRFIADFFLGSKPSLKPFAYPCLPSCAVCSFCAAICRRRLETFGDIWPSVH